MKISTSTRLLQLTRSEQYRKISTSITGHSLLAIFSRTTYYPFHGQVLLPKVQGRMTAIPSSENMFTDTQYSRTSQAICSFKFFKKIAHFKCFLKVIVLKMSCNDDNEICHMETMNKVAQRFLPDTGIQMVP